MAKTQQIEIETREKASVSAWVRGLVIVAARNRCRHPWQVQSTSPHHLVLSFGINGFSEDLKTTNNRKHDKHTYTKYIVNWLVKHSLLSLLHGTPSWQMSQKIQHNPILLNQRHTQGGGILASFSSGQTARNIPPDSLHSAKCVFHKQAQGMCKFFDFHFFNVHSLLERQCSE